MEYREYVAEASVKVGILEGIGHYVKLHKQGRNYVGLCPFHHEKTPSFTVSPDKGMFYCFGCKACGDLFTFVRKIHGVSMQEAVEIISREFSVELPPWHMSTTASRERQVLLGAFKAASESFTEALDLDCAVECRGYLQQRGLGHDTARKFLLGYCPKDVSWLVNQCVTRGVDEGALVRAGIVQRHGNSLSSPFSHRLMFPIWDTIANVIAFGARSIDGSMPKYTNSPETPLFAKRRTLYALPLAEAAIREERTAIVVEGYMDTIALHAHGFTNAIASMGTAFTEEQAAVVKRMAARVLLSFDGDEAGQHAAQQALAVADKTGLDISVVRIRGAKDPDELLKTENGQTQYRAAIDAAISVTDFLLERAATGKDLASTSGRRAFVDEMGEIIGSMQDPLLREDLVRKMSRLLDGVSEKEILSMVLRRRVNPALQSASDVWHIKRAALKHPSRPRAEVQTTARWQTERFITHGIVHFLDKPADIVRLLAGLTLQDEACREIANVVARESSTRALDAGQLIAQLSPEAAALVAQWSAEEHRFSFDSLVDAIKRFHSLDDNSRQPQDTSPQEQELRQRSP
ncbi:MAG: DNA primase [Caldisericota bacterium]|jgi:DNA primase|nr:DNA primase [Caldisericota bacterium]